MVMAVRDKLWYQERTKHLFLYQEECVHSMMRTWMMFSSGKLFLYITYPCKNKAGNTSHLSSYTNSLLHPPPPPPTLPVEPLCNWIIKWIKEINHDLEVEHPQSDSSSTWFLVEFWIWKCWFLRKLKLKSWKLNNHANRWLSILLTSPSTLNLIWKRQSSYTKTVYWYSLETVFS